MVYNRKFEYNKLSLTKKYIQPFELQRLNDKGIIPLLFAKVLDSSTFQYLNTYHIYLNIIMMHTLPVQCKNERRPRYYYSSIIRTTM